MDRSAHAQFTVRLRSALEADPRVLGLVVLGSASGEPPLPDAFSDHDFFVVVPPGEQERLRTDLGWLPDAGELVFSYRETAHGVKAIYRSGHLLEFAVFDPGELGLARVNRYRTLLDRGGIEERMREVRERTASERREPDRGWLWGQFLSELLVGAGRYRRGERLSGRALLASAAARLASLAGAPQDRLDPLRRFERSHPELGFEVDTALSCPPPEAASMLLRIALALPGCPSAAAEAIAPHLG
jgi:hypothetical protein